MARLDRQNSTASAGQISPQILGAPAQSGSQNPRCDAALQHGEGRDSCAWHVEVDVWNPCCEGILLGRDHSRDCPRRVAAAGSTLRDEELAMALQAAELHKQHVHDQRRVRQVVAQDTYQMADPLWGEIVCNEPPSFFKRFLFGCCPCCVVGCTTKEAVRSWRNFLVSFSTLFAFVQVAVLLFTIVLSGSMVSLEKNPMLGPHYHILDTAGAKNAAKILLRGEWWRIFTAEMLHAGWIHLAGNLCVQLRTGCALEVLWGHSFWLVIYLSSGTYATLASCVFHPDRIGVGSSGALCGLIGAWLAFIVITWNQTLPADKSSRNAQAVSITASIILIVATSFLPLMDMAAHAGGLIMGASIAMVVFGNRLQSFPYRVATLCTGVFLVVALITCTTYIFVNDTDPSILLLNLCQPPAC